MIMPKKLTMKGKSLGKRKVKAVKTKKYTVKKPVAPKTKVKRAMKKKK
jgi:hypothetical protein